MKVPGILTPGASIMLLGQAPGQWETKRGRPFCGPAGHELDKWLVAAGLAQPVKQVKPRPDRWVWAGPGPFGPLDPIEWRNGKAYWVYRDTSDYRVVDRSALAITNVWDEELPTGGLAEMTATRREAKEEGWDPRGTPVVRGRYLREQWWGWETRLAAEIETVKPNLIIGFGNEALWALNGHVGIESWRGALFMSRFGVKALCTFHPAGILRGGYRNRPLAIADLIKAASQAQTPTLDLPRRELWLNPSIEDLETFSAAHLQTASWIAVDIETAKGEVTSVGFAPSPRVGICCPFVVDGGSYWGCVSEEVAAWKWVKRWCESPTPKILQNGMYDAQWLWVKRGIRLMNYLHDTRLMHHALFPELPKSLGFMGALWEQEQAWKQWSARHSEKRDDA